MTEEQCPHCMRPRWGKTEESRLLSHHLGVCVAFLKIDLAAEKQKAAAHCCAVGAEAMTPEERAEKAARNYVCNGHDPSTRYEIGAVRGLTVLLTAQIREAVEEATVDLFQMARQAKTEAYEDCAKLSWKFCDCVNGGAFHNDEARIDNCAAVRAIRVRAKEVLG